MLKIKGFGPKCFIEQEYKTMDKISMNYNSKWNGRIAAQNNCIFFYFIIMRFLFISVENFYRDS